MSGWWIQVGHTTLGSGAVTASLVFIFAVVVLRFFRITLLRHFERLSNKTKNDLDDLIVRLLKDIPLSFYVIAAVFISLQFMVIPEFLNDALWAAVLILSVYYIVKSLHIIVEYFRDKIIAKQKTHEEGEDVTFITLIANIFKYSLWVVGFLVILSNVGVDISALIAGLGIGGIAIALAAQNILDDVFSSFSIYFDKPFRVGDFIFIGEDRGVVEKIGIKTTRIKTLRGEELVVSNKEMTSTRVHNFGKMPDRRGDFSFGVTYDTPVDKLEKIPGIVKAIVESQDLVRFDRAHFKKFADSSLEFEVVYYIDSPEYLKYMDAQQAINLALKKAFEEEGIEFAYPTQTLYVTKE